MSAVIHRTPGIIPLESFTVFGMSAKPDSLNPIGKFGTGLKIAIAVLLRHDISVTIFRGHEEYVFYTKPQDFRGKAFQVVRMRRRRGALARWTYTELPFTTELGRHWELWMAFRELHSNTLDENGTTFDSTGQNTGRNVDTTDIVVEGSAYLDCYHGRARVFLPDGLKVRSDDAEVQVIDRPSKYLYFRGLRVMDLKQEAQFTYNILREMTLTEDRTLKYASEAEAVISRYMQASKDEAYLQKTVAAPPSSSYEAHVGHYSGSIWHGVSVTPTKAFSAAAERSANPTAKKLFEDMQPKVADRTTLMVTIPKPLLDKGELDAFCTLVDGWIKGAYVTDIAGQRINDGDDIVF